jgi:hypothetical protein
MAAPISWSSRTSVSRNAASPLPLNLNSLSDPNSQRNQQNVANINRSSLLFDSSWPKKQNLERLDPLLISQLCFATISKLQLLSPHTYYVYATACNSSGTDEHHEIEISRI